MRDASEVEKVFLDWLPLYEAGRVEYHQGEPGTSEAYLLPDFQGLSDNKVASLGLCLVHARDPEEWYLVPARQGVDAWEIAAAYIRLGYSPPVSLIHQLTRNPRTSLAETGQILDHYRTVLDGCGMDAEKARLLHIKTALGV